MGKKQGRVVTPNPPRKSGGVSTPAPKDWIVFSFRYLDCEDSDFGLGNCDEKWLHDMLGRMRDLCRWKATEFHSNRSKTLRAHEIDFADTTRPDGFGTKNPALSDLPGYQFSLGKKNGRVHGILLGYIFYVVWLDPNHTLYE